AAAGFDKVKVFSRPRVKIIATGDEVVAPGSPLEPGKLYASNLVTLVSWCNHFDFPVSWALISDEKSQLKIAVEKALSENDVLITSGGAWKGPKDLVLRVLKEVGWQEIFNYVRIGPGKAISFGKIGEKVIFCLPGGPPSNQMAFLNLALPGLLRLCGRGMNPFPTIKALNRQRLSGEREWTQFFFGKILRKKNCLWFQALPFKSRLSYVGQADALAILPEGQDVLKEGESICVRMLKPCSACDFSEGY
ncbi:molybdopterin-binding protein, partial [Thermodesulfatator indicus]